MAKIHHDIDEITEKSADMTKRFVNNAGIHVSGEMVIVHLLNGIVTLLALMLIELRKRGKKDGSDA